MTNQEIVDITLYSLTGEMEYKRKRKQRLCVTLNIDERNVILISNFYSHKEYLLVDNDTGEILLTRSINGETTAYDTAWLTKECETYGNTIKTWRKKTI